MSTASCVRLAVSRAALELGKTINIALPGTSEKPPRFEALGRHAGFLEEGPGTYPPPGAKIAQSTRGFDVSLLETNMSDATNAGCRGR